MRSLGSTLIFLIALAAVAGRAEAHVPLFAPRVSLSLALDWNKMARTALSRPAAPATVVARKHDTPKLAVTGATVATTADVSRATIARVEAYARLVVTPSYTAPEPVQRERLFRAAFVMPYAPYLGCYGALLTVQSDLLLR